MLGERVEQILDSNATNQEKLPAEKVKQEIIVNHKILAIFYKNR